VDGNISSGTGAITLNDTINVVGAADFDSTLACDGKVRMVGCSAIAVTMNGYITPTCTFQELTSAGTVGTAYLAAGTDGDLVCLWVSSATQVTISDTGTIMLSGDAVITQYDNLCLLSDGTNWYEIAQANN